jgi:hypothetical protein
LKFKILIRIPLAQANSSSSIDEILRERFRIIIEELKSARALKVLKTPSSGVEEVELELGPWEKS